MNALKHIRYILITLPFVLCSCEKDLPAPEDTVHTSMLAFYAESLGLLETSADSVIHYYSKFEGFHETYPECEADEYYPPTVENVDNAFTRYGVVKIGSIFIKTEWDGEIEINY